MIQIPSTSRGETRKNTTRPNPNSHPTGNSICKTCNHRIRSDKHNDGAHHNNRVFKK